MKSAIDSPGLTLRPARPNDAPVAANLILLSMRGEADVLFGHEKHLSASDVAGKLFMRKGERFSFEYATVAEINRHPAGLLLAYPGQILPRLDRVTGRHFLELFGIGAMFRMMIRILPYNLREAERDEYYLSNVAVLPSFQGQGIGTLLMAYADEKAQVSGLEKCSLMVESENDGARRLYEREGYDVVSTHRLPFKHGMGFHRMVKRLIVPGI
jgi:ribosomal protein S18 acetylase RimI-like enzyme